MTPATLPLIDHAHDVRPLNELLHLELAASDGYQGSIDLLGTDATGELFDCLYSHQLRAEYISERILDLRGLPAAGRGPGTPFADLIADLGGLGDRRTRLLALRDAEGESLRVYLDQLAYLDRESQRLAERELLPEQRRTLRVMNALFSLGRHLGSAGPRIHEAIPG